MVIGENKRGFTLRVELPTFETLKLLQQNHSISEIAKYRKVSRQAIYSILSSLIKKGLVEKKAYATYDLTLKGISTLHSLVGLRYKLRQHNLNFKIKVLESPKNWDLKRNELRQLPFFNKLIKLKNNEQELFNYGKLSIKTTTQSLIVKVPTLYARNWEEAIIQGMGILEESIPKLEKVFKVKLIKDYKSNIKIISQEYARIQDALAKIYRREGSRLYITGDDGKIWMITDFSFSTDETEFIHPDKATDDIDAIAPMLNDLRKNPTTFSEVREVVNELVNVVKMDAINRIKHQKVLDEMLITLKKIQENKK